MDVGGRWSASGRGKWVVAILAMVAVVGGGVAITHTALFSAKTITVRGASHLSQADVLRVAGVQRGTNVFYLDTEAARRRLVANSWVASATVIRSLPSTVEITVEEVRPIAVTASAETPMLLAQDGTVLGPAPAATRLPVIGTAGESSARDGAGVLGAMAKPFLAHIAAVDVAADGSITLTLRDGVTVTYGDSADVVRKARALRAVLAWARSQPIGVVSIDVSSPAVPTARLRGMTGATAIAPPPSPSSSASASRSVSP
ncbi:MAG: cell division protein FtsQ [Actinomycetota bacterium]|jgi:cell division protein FtsQ|nr:cell division protein FtsQ [Actinomycetota bacterium]